MPRTKGSKNRPKTNTTKDYASQIAEKQEVIVSLTAECFQMLICSVVMAYSCNMLYRVTKRKWVVVLGVLFYGVFPFVSVQVMCTTKDVLFSALFLLFVLLMLERTFFAKGKRRNVIDVCMVLSGILMIMFRNNAFYAALVAAVLILLFCGKCSKKKRLILKFLIMQILWIESLVLIKRAQEELVVMDSIT
uniref:Uncharacterized protein n=1 Tax=uncultured prokaryote TaxID=198431 RepID=A0A0H5Q880_9ZZZZ|nr:hypothetical protein [uncultured prokaryote]